MNVKVPEWKDGRIKIWQYVEKKVGRKNDILVYNHYVV